MCRPGGSVGHFGSFCLMPEMIASVEAEPVFRHCISTDAVAVDMDDVGLRRVAVAHMGDVAHVDHGAVDRLDRQVAEIVESRRRVVELERIFVAADLLRAGRRDQVLRGERVGDILADNPRACSAIGSRSIWIWRSLPPNGQAIAAPGTVTSGVRMRLMREVGELLLGEALAGQRD